MLRDRHGSVVEVRPREVNLMTAGRGISHTEESLVGSEPLHAAQFRIALPYQDRECEPVFDHYPGLPVWRQGDSPLSLLAGGYADELSPAIYSPLLAVDIVSASGDELYLPLDTRFEYGILVLRGGAAVCDQRFVENDLA
ncbi:pirin family protein [Zhongshania sp.]|uniref:pirin family protein n=1 Tax=Zhongshania sp. TaxID=1971902 RepID=UPI0035655D05